MLVLGVTFPAKLEKFCSRHLSYETLPYFSAGLLYALHFLLYGSLSESPSLTPFFLMSQTPPQAFTCCPTSARCPGTVWFTYMRTYGGFSDWCAGAVNPLCCPDTRHLRTSPDRSLHTLAKGYRSPWSSFHIPPNSEASYANRTRRRQLKIYRGHM